MSRRMMLFFLDVFFFLGLGLMVAGAIGIMGGP